MRRSSQTAIWLIGIGVLALTGWWWPGIMFLVALSALASGSFQGFIWLAGIGLLALFDFWWPGILILAGIGLLAGSLRRPVGQAEPDTERLDAQPQPPSVPNPVPPPVDVEAPTSQPGSEPAPDMRNLPENCPACGGPVSHTTIEWHANQAYCGFCGSALKAQTPPGSQ